MITRSEKQQIIDEAVERAILLIPEVVGNLMSNHVALAKINREFYSKYPEFKNKKDIVASVIEAAEMKNPNADYEDLLEQSVGKIRKHIKLSNQLSIDEVTTPPSQDLNGLL